MIWGGNTGLPRSTFLTIVGDLGPSYTPAALCPRRGIHTSPDRLHTFWCKLNSLFSLFLFTARADIHLRWPYHPNPSPHPGRGFQEGSCLAAFTPPAYIAGFGTLFGGLRTSMDAPCKHASIGYPWGNTGSGQRLTGRSQTVIYMNATSCRDMCFKVVQLGSKQKPQERREESFPPSAHIVCKLKEAQVQWEFFL